MNDGAGALIVFVAVAALAGTVFSVLVVAGLIVGLCLLIAKVIYPAVSQWWWERNREKRIREEAERTQKEIGQVTDYYVRLHRYAMQTRR